MSTVSIIIPTYNSAVYIGAALRSIFAQTFLPTEIIIVDDCSTDETSAIIKKMQADSPVEIRLIHMPGNSGGPVKPMNVGVEAARSEFIAMLDHDDIMLPDRLSLALMACAENDKVGMVFGQTVFMDGTGQLREFNQSTYAKFTSPRQQFTPQELLDDLLTHGYRYGGAGGMLFRKSAWNDLGGFAESYKIAWDCEFTARLALAGWSFIYISKVLYYHRIHANNLQHSGAGQNLLLEYIRMYDELRQCPGLSPLQQQGLSYMLCERYNRLANISLLEKKYIQSAKYYWQSITRGRCNFRSLKGFLRIPYYYFYKNHTAQPPQH